MQFYPQHYYGFAVNNDVAERLQLNEAFDEYEMTYDEMPFFESFETKFGIEPDKFADTTYEKGGYVQGLSGFDWDRTYICFDPSQASGEKWEKMINALSDVDIDIEEGHWSQLG
tara:strand:+ start:2594 stop:2935 length:342 start_codon:yes stop_codon:yes gene_type:complete